MADGIVAWKRREGQVSTSLAASAGFGGLGAGGAAPPPRTASPLLLQDDPAPTAHRPSRGMRQREDWRRPAHRPGRLRGRGTGAGPGPLCRGRPGVRAAWRAATVLEPTPQDFDNQEAYGRYWRQPPVAARVELAGTDRAGADHRPLAGRLEPGHLVLLPGPDRDRESRLGPRRSLRQSRRAHLAVHEHGPDGRSQLARQPVRRRRRGRSRRGDRAGHEVRCPLVTKPMSAPTCPGAAEGVEFRRFIAKGGLPKEETACLPGGAAPVRPQTTSGWG
jgi:hypothetical protein